MCARLSAWVALRCKESLFQRFLGVTTEAAAADRVRALCGVASRGEIDRDEQARAKFHEAVRLPYQQFYHHQES